MKRVLFAVAGTLMLFASVSASVFAAPKNLAANKVNSFDGTFSGVIYGDKGSHAPLTIKMDQYGNEILGTLILGSGLYVDGGRCGGGYIPATTQYANGKVDKKNPDSIEASTAIKVAGIKVNIELEGSMSKDGETIEAEAKVNLPWLCGRDPVVDAYLIKEQ